MNAAKTARDEAESNASAQETKKTEENDKIAALQTAYDEKLAEKTEAREIKTLNDAADILYGKPEEGEEKAVIGV